LQTGIGNPANSANYYSLLIHFSMNQNTLTSPYLQGDCLGYVLDFVLDSTTGKSITTRAFEWEGCFYSILIASEDESAEQTVLLMEDLLNVTLMDHKNRGFKPLRHAVHNSKEFNYGGVTVIHDSLEDALDYARYMRIKIQF
jgi:hypothetical protein